MAIPVRRRLLESGDYRLLETGDYRLVERAYDPYEGYDVFPFRLNLATDSDIEIVRSATILENRTGLHTVRSHTVSPVTTVSMVVTLQGRAEISAFRQYLKYLKGRALPIWVPTWKPDFVPTSTFSSTTMTIESIGYQGSLYPFNARKHIAIIENDGTIHARGVTGASDNGVTEGITFTPSIGKTIYPNACLVSFLLLARLQSDSVLMTWNSSELVDAALTFIELPREAPAP